MRKQSADGVVKGALFLALAGLFVKAVGMIYKIPLTNRLGDSGMGYFNAAYTVYTFFFVLSSSGLPTALSLSVSKDLALGREDLAGGRFFVMRRFCLLLGIALFLLLFLLARPFASFLGSAYAYPSLLAISPALVFVSVSSVYRGYYQGRGNMLPTASSQALEAFGKLFFGLSFLSLALSYRVRADRLAAYAILGLSVATLLSCLFLVIFFRVKRETVQLSAADQRKLAVDTLKTAMPITLSALSATLVTSLDLLLLMRALQGIGYSSDAANAAWGNYSSLVLPLFHMPQILITPIAASVLPFFRGAITKGDEEKRRSLIMGAVVATALISALSALGLSLFSRDILQLIYTDPTAIARAYPHLALVAIAVFPFGLTTVSASLLQAHGKLWLPTVSLVLGAVFKLFFTLFGVSLLGEAVSPFATLLSYTLSAAINFAALVKIADVKLFSRAVYLPFATASLSVTAGLVVRRYLESVSCNFRLATLFSIVLTGVFWMLLILASGILKTGFMRDLLNSKIKR